MEKERILVVDDEIEACRTLKDFMVFRGYEVQTAQNGKEAIDKVKSFKPHIVLLDIIMPGMGGIEALKEIKKMAPKTGVIMVSAVGDEETAKKTMELGAYDYILKPFDLNYLENVVIFKIVDVLG
jgi:DNA-binding response OmpR family regulator